MTKEDFYALVERRQSIRAYKSDMPPRDVLDRLLNAAMHAPSGKNRQNWRFFVVSGKKRDEYLSY